MSLETYLKDHLKVKRTFRNQAERKKYLKENGTKFVKHPTTSEDMVAVEAGMNMLTGKRVSSKREKVRDFTDGEKGEGKQAMQKASENIDMRDRVLTQAGCLG